MTTLCPEPRGEAPDMRAQESLLHLPNALSHPLHSHRSSSHFEDEVNGGGEPCKNPQPRPPFLCRFGFYISRPFRQYLICLNRPRIEKVSISRYASRFIGYMIVRCHLVESEWSQIWRETCSIKMSGACPPLLLTSLPLSVLLRNYLVQALSHYLNTMYPSSFIQAYLSHLNSKSRTVCCIRISRHKAITHQSSKAIQGLQEPQVPSRIKNTDFCPRPRYLDPSSIKGNLGCCIGIRA